MRRLPPLGALEAFVTGAQRQSLRAAAADLNLSPSALSRRIQALEVHVGRKVFDRQAGEFRLTPEGQALLDRLAPAFDTLTLALEELRGDGRELLRLGVPPAFASAWLLPRLARFKSRYPSIEVALDTVPASLSRLASTLDAAVIVSDQVLEGFYARELRRPCVMMVCSPAYAESAGPLERPSDLAGHTVLAHRDLSGLLDTWLAAAGADDVKPRRVDYYDTGSVLVDAASHGLGVAVLFDITVTPHLESGRLVQALPQVATSPWRYWFACRQAMLSTRAVRRIHDWILEELGEADHVSPPERILAPVG